MGFRPSDCDRQSRCHIQCLYFREIMAQTGTVSDTKTATRSSSLNHQCIPFTAIPHTTRLYQDYLFHHARVAEFYQHPPTPDAVFDYGKQLEFPAERRAQVAAVLTRQNRAFGADEQVFEAIERLRGGAVAVVSGQQVGLFGGPLYSILKAVSAVELARSLSGRGLDAVPVFWLATEDHDLAEVNHTFLPAAAGGLERLTSSSQGTEGAPVGYVKFGEEISAAAARVRELLGDGEIARAVVEAYRPGETYGSAFAKLFAKLLAGTGLILLDPLDPELHAIAAPVFSGAAARAREIDDALLSRGKQLQASDYHEQVRVTGESTLLFSLEGGERRVIHLSGEDFTIGRRRVGRDELLEQVRSAPELFSSNVLLRPIVQDYLLPTVAYFGGAAEVAYFAQVGVVYEKLLGRVTPVLPRFSATVVDGRMQRLLQQYQLGVPDLFHGTEQLREKLAARSLPAGMQHELSAAKDTLQEIISRLREHLRTLDPTLVDATERSGRKMQYQLSKIAAKAARAKLRQDQRLAQEGEEIITLLFPEKGLQERTIPGVYFLARYGRRLIGELMTLASEHCPGHHIVNVG